MPKLSFMNSLLRRGKRSIPSEILKFTPVLNIREGESAVLTYTSSANKMKVFSSFIRAGLESGDTVWYSYPDEEKETVRVRLEKYGIDVKHYEEDGALRLKSIKEYLMLEGKLDYGNAVEYGLEQWDWAKSQGYKHARAIEDVGDFSFADGQWQDYVSQYWLDPGWDDPTVSNWVKSKDPVGVVYDPFIMEITAINVERMTEQKVSEILRALGRGNIVSVRFIDLLENAELFSRSIALNHEQLLGYKILLEFDPTSNYEKVVESLAKESMANVEPIFVFTSSTSPICKYLAKQPSIKFFLTSISTSTSQSTSENTVLLPAKNAPLILDAISKVLETYGDANVCFVFDILSEFLSTLGRERTFTFLRQALDMLSSEKTTSLFLLNTSAHETEVVSGLRNRFSNQLTYDKNGLEIVKTS